MNTKIYDIGTAVVYDDHKLFASTFSMLLERTGLFSAVYAFSQEDDVMSFCCSQFAGRLYLFLDYLVPNGNVIHLIADVRRFKPSASIIVVSSLTNIPHIKRILAQKVNGFISKSAGSEEVITCIHAVLNKEIFISPFISAILESEHTREVELTTRELQVLSLIAQGDSTSQIAEKLNITNSTVLTHRKNMMGKTSFGSIIELLSYALRVGLIPNT